LGAATRCASLRFILIAWVAVGFIACSEIAPTNPYDPSTPAGQQAAATITGAFKLYDEAVPDAVLDEVALSPAGTFVFDEVPPGDYLVRAHVDGFRDGERTLRLDAGVRYDLGELPLPALASPDAVGSIAGVARRVDAPEDGHGGIRVQVLGTPWQAETEDTGHYRVVVAPGLYAVGFSADG